MSDFWGIKPKIGGPNRLFVSVHAITPANPKSGAKASPADSQADQPI
jgi:hypothetical protein